VYVRFDLNDYSIHHDRTRRTLVAFVSLDVYGEEVAMLMVRGDPWQGATREIAQIMFGRPDDVSTRVHKQTTAEVWKYVPLDARRYALRVEFENGVCVGWQTA
jgi:hypothetical protein